MNIDFSKYPYPPRLRHHTAPALYIPKNELHEIPNGYPPLIDNPDWGEFFSNNQPPNVLDVGCGKAGLLLDYSELHPSENILGIEVRKLIADWAENFIRCEKIPNAAVFHYTVVNGLDFIDNGSITNIFYLFPDPWTKKRQQKRRAFNDATLEEFSKKLHSGGILYLATDLPAVHEYHLEELEKNGKFNIKIIDNDADWQLPVTNKESFCRRESIPFFRIKAYKK